MTGADSAHCPSRRLLEYIGTTAVADALADALGDTPETVISAHLLRRGLARVWVDGEPGAFRAAAVQNLAFSVDEPTGFGALGHPADARWVVVRQRGADGRRCGIWPMFTTSWTGSHRRSGTKRSGF